MKKQITIFTLIFLILILVGTATAQADSKTDKNEEKSTQQTKDRPLKITRVGGISLNVLDKCFDDSRNKELFIRLRVTFHGSGEITDVEVLQDSGCEYFNKVAIETAKKIKFKTAIKDGEPITTRKVFEYRVGNR